MGEFKAEKSIELFKSCVKCEISFNLAVVMAWLVTFINNLPRRVACIMNILCVLAMCGGALARG
jgi:hypothetical protein